MSFRRHRLWATATAAVAATIAAAHAHNAVPEFLEDGRRAHACIHDTPVLRAMQDADMKLASTQHEALRRASADTAAERGFDVQAARKPMRFTVSDKDLFTSGRYCINGKHARVPDLQGNKVACPADKSLDLTPAKRAFLKQTLLPRAVASLSRMLSVTPMTSPIKINSCGFHTVRDDFKSQGAPNSDFVLHVAAVPTGRGVVAWAGACKHDWTTMRPLAGYANFNPAYIDPSGSVDNQVETAVHELMHALGFSRAFFGKSSYQIPTATVQRRGITVKVLQGTAVLREGKAHFGCSDFDGMEVENEGGGGTAGSHFERRLMMQDTMAGVGGPKVSRLTLAVFEDLSFYTANYSAADDTTTFGRNGGCGFFREKCNTVAGGAGKWFCFDEASGCNADRTGVGYCSIGTYTTNVPEPFRYFDDPKKAGTAYLMDYCPVMRVWNNRWCVSTTHVPSTWDSRLGHYFGADGRCIDAKSFGKMPYTSGGEEPVCVKHRCRGTTLDLQLPHVGAPWVECTSAGQKITHDDYAGHLACPAPAELCNGASTTTAAPVAQTNAPVNVPVTSAPKTAKPSTPKPVTPMPSASPGGYTATIRVYLKQSSAVDAIMTVPGVKRNKYLRSIIQTVRQQKGLPWPTYKVKRTFFKSKKFNRWVVKMVFTGPSAPSQVAAHQAVDPWTQPVVRVELGDSEGVKRTDGLIEPPHDWIELPTEPVFDEDEFVPSGGDDVELPDDDAPIAPLVD